MRRRRGRQEQQQEQDGGTSLILLNFDAELLPNYHSLSLSLGSSRSVMLAAGHPITKRLSSYRRRTDVDARIRGHCSASAAITPRSAPPHCASAENNTQLDAGPFFFAQLNPTHPVIRCTGTQIHHNSTKGQTLSFAVIDCGEFTIYFERFILC